MHGFRIERTGNCFSISSNEFRVTYPDGHMGLIWSPPWHEMSEAEEEAAALKAARRMYAEGKHKTPNSVRVES